MSVLHPVNQTDNAARFLTEGERGAGGKSIVLVDGNEFRVLESIDSIKRRFETPTTANAAEAESQPT